MVTYFASVGLVRAWWGCLPLGAWPVRMPVSREGGEARRAVMAAWQQPGYCLPARMACFRQDDTMAVRHPGAGRADGLKQL